MSGLRELTILAPWLLLAAWLIGVAHTGDPGWAW